MFLKFSFVFSFIFYNQNNCFFIFILPFLFFSFHHSFERIKVLKNRIFIVPLFPPFLSFPFTIASLPPFIITIHSLIILPVVSTPCSIHSLSSSPSFSSSFCSSFFSSSSFPTPSPSSSFPFSHFLCFHSFIHLPLLLFLLLSAPSPFLFSFFFSFFHPF